MQMCAVRCNRPHKSQYFEISRKHVGLVMICQSQTGGLEAADAGNDESRLAAGSAQRLFYPFAQIFAR